MPMISAATTLTASPVSRLPLRPLLPATADDNPTLPAWITDTFAAQYASHMLQQAGHTALGQAMRQLIDDPFVFLHQARIGGFSDSIAAGNASIAASVAPNRLAGTLIGAAIGSLSGAGQAMMTYPGTSTVIVGAIHGLVMGGIAGNVAVVESRHSRQAVVDHCQRLW